MKIINMAGGICNHSFVMLLIVLCYMSAFSALIAALCSDKWLYSIEKLTDPKNATLELFKSAYSGLWKMCYHYTYNKDLGIYPEDKMTCINIDYFPSEPFDPGDSTDSISIVIRTAIIFIFLTLLIIFFSGLLFFSSFTKKYRRVSTIIISGILFIVAGLFILVGLVHYISKISGEVGNKLTAKSTFDIPQFRYYYGWSFILASSSFLFIELAGLIAVLLFISMFKHSLVKEDMKRVVLTASGSPLPTEMQNLNVNHQPPSSSSATYCLNHVPSHSNPHSNSALLPDTPHTSTFKVGGCSSDMKISGVDGGDKENFRLDVSMSPHKHHHGRTSIDQLDVQLTQSPHPYFYSHHLSKGCDAEGSKQTHHAPPPSYLHYVRHPEDFSKPADPLNSTTGTALLRGCHVNHRGHHSGSLDPLSSAPATVPFHPPLAASHIKHLHPSRSSSSSPERSSSRADDEDDDEYTPRRHHHQCSSSRGKSLHLNKLNQQQGKHKSQATSSSHSLISHSGRAVFQDSPVISGATSRGELTRQKSLDRRTTPV